MRFTRRRLLEGIGLAGLEAIVPPLVKKPGSLSSAARSTAQAGASTCPFRLAVINDEITQDFEKACQIVSSDFGFEWIELRSMWNKNVTELDATAARRRAKNSRRAQTPRHRHRQPALQNRLARRTNLPTKRTPRSIPRRLRRHRARQTPRPLHHPRQNFRNRPHPLLRFLAPRRSRPLPRRHQRQAATSRATLRQRKSNPAPRKRNVLQHRLRRRIRRRAKSHPRQKFHAQLGSRQRRGSRQHALSRRLRPAPEKSHRPLPLQRCHPQARSQIRLGPSRRRYRGLGRPARSPASRRLPLRPKPRNPLARRRHARSLHTHQHGRPEESASESSKSPADRARMRTTRQKDAQ